MRSFLLLLTVSSFLNMRAQKFYPDSSFNGNGEVFTPKRGLITTAHCIIQQPDGKLLVGGEVGLPHPFWYISSFFLYRLNTNGQIDASFADTGKFQSKLNPAVLSRTPDRIMTMVVQPDLKILVAGAFNQNVAVMRLHSNGTIDTSFGLNGLVEKNLNSQNQEARSIVLLSNGSFIIDASDGNDFVLLKYDSTGTPDPSFGNAGTVITDFNQSTDQSYSLLLQPDGKLVAAGYRWENATGNDFAVVRYKPDGSLDASFGNGGIQTVDLGSIHDYGYTVHLRSNGNLLVTGCTTAGDGKSKYAAAELLPSGAINAAFGTNGKVIAKSDQRDNFPETSILMPNGDVIICGNSYDFAGSFFMPLLMKVSPTGKFDYNLNGNGFCYYKKAPATNSQFRDMTMQQDGRLVGCGMSNFPGDMRFDAIRFRYAPAPVITTGIDESTDRSHWHVYPNPVNDVLQISGEEEADVDVKLFNAQGQLILNRKNVSSLELSKFPAGMYVLELSCTDRAYSELHRVVKIQ